MITKISKLDNIGSFSNLNQEKVFQYGEKGQNCNIVFGFNGSGKTTVSNAISFFADNSFIGEEEKKEIYDDIKNDDNAVVELSLQNGSPKYPASNEHSKSIYIFNSHFVETHVFNGTKGKIKKFSNIGGEITNKNIDSFNAQITELEKEKKKLDKENDRLNEKHQDITRNRSKNFGKSLTDKNKSIQVQNLLQVSLPTKTIEDLEVDLENLVADYDLSKKQTELKGDLENLRQTDFNQKVDVDLTDIDDLLSKNVQQLSKEFLENKIKEIQNLFKDDLYKQSTEKWFRFGKDVLKKIDINTEEKICPICNTDITNKFKNLLSDYEEYFDDTYDKFIKTLNEKTEATITGIEVVEKCELDADKLEIIVNKYKNLLTGFTIEKHDFTQIKEKLTKLETSLKSKNDNIQQNFNKPLDIDDTITEANLAIARFATLKKSILSLLESKKLNTNTIEDNIRKTYKELILLEFNQIKDSGSLALYIDNNSRVSKIKDIEIPKFKNYLANELKEIKAESKSISKYLIKMGITNFDIDINKDQEDENIVVRYKNSNQEKNKLKNSLSGGEKTALAFAYFLSKFENEINTDDKIRNSVVVIDDPISSLDENRLYSTAYLIHKNFENVKQLIVLSHNLLFLKHFNSLSKKPKCFFLDQDKLSDLPEELRNFESPYYYMLRNLFDFNNGNIEYNQVKKHLPNYIRRILETFLSFKFSRIVNKNGGNRSPGLKEFDDNITQTDLNAEIKEEIKEKIISINSICDQHSHGNMHHTQENFYISEADLRTLAQDTICIIETMDNLHKTCFVKTEN